MSKGSRQRTLNSTKFNDNYDSIFGDKNESDNRIPRQQEEKCADKKTVHKQGKGESV